MGEKVKMSQKELRSLVRTLVTRFSFIPLILGLLVLLPSGTFNFWQVYLYLGVLVVPMCFVLVYFLRKDPEFLQRRTNKGEKEKEQRFISILSTVVFLSGFVIPGLDHRFGWSDVPVYIVLVADTIILLGYILIILVFKQNSYASNIIEVTDNQYVISTGLYAVVRHPMYVGVMLMFIPTPLALGSVWGLIPFSFLPLVLALRILNEEKILGKNLKGYTDYCQKTKYRLIPWIW